MLEADAARGRGAADRVLNQDEIDSLLGFDPYCRRQPGAIGRAGADQLGARFLRTPAQARNRLRPAGPAGDDEPALSPPDNVEVAIDSIFSVRFGDYLNSIPLPAILAVIKAEEWETITGCGRSMSLLIYSMIDALLGGRRVGGTIRVEGRPYTTIEMAPARRMIEVILEDTHRAFEPVTEVNFKVERLETNPRFAAISRPANAAILIELRIEMDDRGRKIEILLPYATIELIREQLLQMEMGEKFGRDLIWKAISLPRFSPPTSRSRRSCVRWTCR